MIAAGTFHVTPGPGLIVWVALIWVILSAGAITAAKGHWKWVLLGLLTGGTLWLAAALFAARPYSLWQRTFDRSQP